MQGQVSQSRAGGGIYIVLTLVAWSAVPLFLKYFTDYIDGWTANGWRYGVAAFFWLPVLLVGWMRGRLPRGLWRAAIVPSVVNCIGQSCFAWAPYYIDPALLTFMLRFQVIFVAFGAFMLFPSERRILRSPHYWCAVVVVFAGSLGAGLLGAELPRGATALGIILAVAAGLFFAGYSLSVRYYMNGVRPVVAFAAISQYTAAGLIAIMLVAGERRGLAVVTLTQVQWAMLLGSALVGIAFAHVFYYTAIGRLGVVVSAGVILLQPFLTGAGSYFMFGERLTVAQWVAGVLAVGGAIVMLRAQQHLGRGGDEPTETRGPLGRVVARNGASSRRTGDSPCN